MKDDIEIQRAAMLKAARSMIRLRHSIEADRELNEVLPALGRKFDAAVASGTLPNPTALLLDLVTGDGE
jgi:hypothetical protein